MLVPLREALQRQILSRRPRGRKVPDSTTNMSSVVFTLNLPGDGLTSIPETETTESSEVIDSNYFVSSDAETGSQTIPRTDGTEHDDTLDALPAIERLGLDCRITEDDDEDDLVVFKGRHVLASFVP